MDATHQRSSCENKNINQNTFSAKENKSVHKVDKQNLLTAIIKWDEKWTDICAVCAHKGSALSAFRPLMKAIEISCHGIPWLLGTIILILSVHQQRHIELLVNLFYGLIIDIVITVILKMIFRRSRPMHNHMDMFATVSVDHYSFPSGHAARAAMLACFFSLHVFSSPLWILLVTAWSLIVTISRVCLGRHHVIDVVCGYIVGIGEYLMLIYLWISTEICMNWLELYFSHFHL